MTKTREDFEAWAEEDGCVLSRFRDGKYTFVSTRVAWRAWVAATGLTQERALAAQLEAEEYMESPDETWEAS